MIEKINTIQRIQEDGIVAVVRHIPQDKIPDMAEALITSGITALEVTVDSENAFTIIESLAKRYKGRAMIGAGTVLDGMSAQTAISKGAEFVISPHFNPEVVKTTLRYGKVAIPGVMTPTEMMSAIECGADIVKVFPATTLGVQFIKDIKGPFPQIPIIPTGGITVKNIGSFIQAGVEAVGIGGSLLPKQAMVENDFDLIQSIANQFVKEVRKAKKTIPVL